MRVARCLQLEFHPILCQPIDAHKTNMDNNKPFCSNFDMEIEFLMLFESNKKINPIHFDYLFLIR